MADRINKKVIDAQNDWALSNSDNPYRTANMDMDLWELIASDQYDNAKAICQEPKINKKNGKHWDQHYNSWEQFCNDTNNVWNIDSFKKDLNINKRPQRPTDVGHLYQDLIKHHGGVFCHALAGPIDVAIRPDGSVSTWDHWHTVCYAKLCGIEYLRVNKLVHNKDMTLEECRAVECGLYYSKNGLSKKSTAEDVFEKSVVVSKHNGKGARRDPNIALMAIYERLLLSPTGKNPNYRPIQGVSVIKLARARLIKNYGSAEVADKKITDYLRLLRDSFKTGSISGYFFLGIVDFMSKFEAKFSPVLTVKNLAEMFDELTRAGRTQQDFIATAQNQKGLPAESISMRLANFWSKWMKTSGRANRVAPITYPAALKAYGKTLPEIEIKTQFQSKDAAVEVQCPECQNMHKVRMSDLKDIAA